MAQSSIKPQCFSCIAVNLGTFFMIGTVIGWSKTVIPGFKNPHSPEHLTGDEIEWVMNIQGFGTMLGPIVTWFLIDRIGRKATIILCVPPMSVSYLVMAVEMEYTLLLISRILGGLGFGIILSAVPIYVGEISEVRIRGAMGLVSGVTYNCGILFPLIVGPYVTVRRLNMICALIACIFGFLIIAVPESPYYNLMKGKTEEAATSLTQLRNTTNVHDELNLMIDYVERKRYEVSSTFDLLTKRGNRRASLIVMILMMTSVYSGSLALPNYAYEIFKDSGYDGSSYALVIGMGVAMLVGSVIGIFLIDRLGRRKVIFIGNAIMLLCLIASGTFFTLKAGKYDVSSFGILPFVAVIGYMISVAAGVHCLPSVILSEYFSTIVKAKAAMVASIIMAMLGSTSIKLFDEVQDRLGLGPTFFICSGPLIFGTIILYFIMPETKGISFQSIEDMHSDRSCETIPTDVETVFP